MYIALCRLGDSFAKYRPPKDQIEGRIKLWPAVYINSRLDKNSWVGLYFGGCKKILSVPYWNDGELRFMEWYNLFLSPPSSSSFFSSSILVWNNGYSSGSIIHWLWRAETATRSDCWVEMVTSWGLLFKKSNWQTVKQLRPLVLPVDWFYWKSLIKEANDSFDVFSDYFSKYMSFFEA